MRWTTVAIAAFAVWLVGCGDVEAQSYDGTLRDLGTPVRPDIVDPAATITVTLTGPASDRASSIRVVIDGCTLSLVRTATGNATTGAGRFWELADDTAVCETGTVTSAHVSQPYPDSGVTIAANVWWLAPTLADQRHVDFWGTRR